MRSPPWLVRHIVFCFWKGAPEDYESVLNSWWSTPVDILRSGLSEPEYFPRLDNKGVDLLFWHYPGQCTRSRPLMYSHTPPGSRHGPYLVHESSTYDGRKEVSLFWMTTGVVRSGVKTWTSPSPFLPFGGQEWLEGRTPVQSVLCSFVSLLSRSPSKFIILLKFKTLPFFPGHITEYGH